MVAFLKRRHFVPNPVQSNYCNRRPVKRRRPLFIHTGYDGSNPVLAFDGSGNLTDRYLWGPAVDQVLADEQFWAGSCGEAGNGGLPTSAGNTLWTLGDNQNSVRDLVSDSGALIQHIAYSPFGQQLAGKKRCQERMALSRTLVSAVRAQTGKGARNR
jgi:hypothetical protein